MIAKRKNASSKHESSRYIKPLKKKLVYWISNVTTSKIYILRKIQKLKNIAISHSTTIFHNFALKIETSWVTRMIMPILKTRNVYDDAC